MTDHYWSRNLLRSDFQPTYTEQETEDMFRAAALTKNEVRKSSGMSWLKYSDQARVRDLSYAPPPKVAKGVGCVFVI